MFIIFFYVLFLLSFLSGWVMNVIWTFHQHDLINLSLGIFGAVCAPIGALHGLYLLF